MRQTILLLLTLLLLASCTDNNGNEENYFLEFRPRKANHVWATPCKIITTEYKGDLYYDYKTINSDDKLKINDFFLSVITADKRTDSLIKTVNPNFEFITFFSDSEFISQGIENLEKEIELNYKRYLNSMKAKSIGNQNAYDYTSKIDIEYRIDGVVNFNISSLDAPLFGKPIGTSLNQYFEIFKYDPDFIASYESKRLLYGYTDKVKPTAIDEWLSLSPMAQPTMFLRLNTTPENLPVTLRFKVDMETTDGITISDTTKVITLTN